MGIHVFFLTIENGMINDHLLVGGDWNHGILRLSHHIGNGITIPTDSIFQRGRLNHQPV